MAVPVLFSRRSAQRAHLVSPIGVLLVSGKRKLHVPGPERSIVPTSLRLGDQFAAQVAVPASARREIYTRIVVPGGKLRVTQRTRTLSNDELLAELNQLRSDFASLRGFVAQLGAYTVANVGQLNARLDALRSDVTSLQSSVMSLESQVTAVSGALDAARADLQSKISQVRSDLQPQISALAAQLATLTATLGSSACGGSPDTSTIFGKICNLQNQINALAPTNVLALSNRVTQISSALTNVVGGLTNLSLAGDLPASLTGPINTGLANIFGDVGQVTALGGTVGTLNGTVAGINTSVAGLQSNLGTVSSNLIALSSTVAGANGLTTKVANLITDLGASPTDGSTPAALTNLTSSVATINGQISTINGTLTTVSTGVTNAQNTANAVTSTVNGTVIPNLTAVCTAAKNSVTSLITQLASAHVNVPGQTVNVPLPASLQLGGVTSLSVPVAAQSGVQLLIGAATAFSAPGVC